MRSRVCQIFSPRANPRERDIPAPVSPVSTKPSQVRPEYNENHIGLPEGSQDKCRFAERPFLTGRKEPVSINQEMHVREMGFLLAVFAIIEHLNKSELPPTSKKLIVIYVNEASELSMVEKARTAVRRYSQTVLPTLESIREKARTKKLDALDHLVLKLEYEASRLSR
jgi:hypothetical protein